MSGEADVVKYNISTGEIVENFSWISKPTIAGYFPDDLWYEQTDWLLTERGFHYDAQNSVLFLYVPYSIITQHDGSNPVTRPPALLKVQLPDWTLLKGITFSESISGNVLDIYSSPDMKKIFVQYVKCTEPVNVGEACSGESMTDVYDTSTLNKIKSYKGKMGGTQSSPLRFANDGVSAYYYKDLTVYKYEMTANGINIIDITEAVFEKKFMPASKWEQLKENYGFFSPVSNKKGLKVTKNLNRFFITETFVDGAGKAAMIFVDVDKPALHGAIIEDIPVELGQIYLSDDGTRAYIYEFEQLLDGSRILSKKLSGNIYIYNVMTGALIKKAVVDMLAGKEIIGTMGKNDAVRKCSSSDGMTNVFKIFDGTNINYYLLDFSTEPYLKPMMKGELRMSQVIVAEFCFFSDK